MAISGHGHVTTHEILNHVTLPTINPQGFPKRPGVLAQLGKSGDEGEVIYH